MRPWEGVLVATALPFRTDLSVDFERYAEHVRWLGTAGCTGVVPNGSLGEYQVLAPQERTRVVSTAVAVAAEFAMTVVPGVSAYGSREAVLLTEAAAEAGCPAVMLLPPNAYRADDRAVVAHYRAVAKVGLPVVAYNNPIDTKVDLTPTLLARLYGDGLISAVKEFSGDPRRGYDIAAAAPGLDVIVGSDDVLLELVCAGAVGWIAGIPNAMPVECLALWRQCRSGELSTALPAYKALHPLLRWDSQTEFVQAIKLAMDLVGRYGGPCRPPRLPLSDALAADVSDAFAMARKG